MDISNLINVSNVNLSLNAETKNEAIEELVELMYRNKIATSKEQYLKDVLLREEIGITGMGNAIAIPHGESKGVRTAGIVIGRTKKLIEWESLDDKPVKLIFLLAIPADDKNRSHIKMLSQLASILSYEEIQDDLMSSVNEEAFVSKFKKYYEEYLERNQ